MSEAALRLEALRLASHQYGHNDAEVVTAAAEEFLNFLLDEYETDDYEVPTHTPNGDPVIVSFNLGLEAVINLGVVLSGALAFARDNGIPEDNEISQFATALLTEVRDTLQIVADGAEV